MFLGVKAKAASHEFRIRRSPRKDQLSIYFERFLFLFLFFLFFRFFWFRSLSLLSLSFPSHFTKFSRLRTFMSNTFPNIAVQDMIHFLNNIGNQRAILFHVHCAFLCLNWNTRGRKTHFVLINFEHPPHWRLNLESLEKYRSWDHELLDT